MVNSVSYPPPTMPDVASRVATNTTNAGTSAAPTVPTPQKAEPVKVAVKQPAPAEKAPVSVAEPLISTPPLAPNLTSLALYKDPATGMQVTVIRDKVTGEVIEHVPTERALRLAAMVRQQEAVAQELQQDASGTPRLDLET